MPTPFNSKYSSTEIENFFDLLNSNSFITNTVSNLVNYYLKSDTYSKSEVDSIINTVKNGRFQNVNSLPEQDIDTNVIYLVQKQNTENNNIKDEYINLDGTSTGWEKIGSTEINLDGYVTIQALNTALSNYVQSSNIVTILANKTSFSSVENMVATPAADLYDGCLAYVTATKKNYQYDSSNTVDETLGKWRELQTGGGGGTNYTAGDGIDITEDVISTKQSEEGDIDEIIDVYPQAGSLVSIVNAFNRGDIYSTDERMIGQWIDGKPVYQKVIQTTIPSVGGDSTVSITSLSAENIILVRGIEYNFDTAPAFNQYMSGGESSGFGSRIQVFTTTSTLYVRNIGYTNSVGHAIYVILQYTKTTDSAISIGDDTDYSTEEKIVGTWIDGKPLYQKTVSCGALPNAATGYEPKKVAHNITNLDKTVNFWGIAINPNTHGSCKLGGLGTNSDTTSDLGLFVDSVNVNIKTLGDRSAYLESYVTIQYTKTTT